MTPEQKEAERIKALAQGVYREPVGALQAEEAIRAMVARHGGHPAFQEYMREMCLTDTLRVFIARPSMWKDSR